MGERLKKILFLVVVYTISYAQVTVRDTLIKWNTFKYTLNADHTIKQSTSMPYDTVSVKFHGTVIENEFLKVTLVPEYGGRILSMIYKPTGHEELYQNPVGAPYGIGNGWFYYNWLMVYGGIFPTLPEPEHGKAWLLHWDYEILLQTSDTVRCKMTWIDTVILESADVGKWKYGQTGIKCEYILTLVRGASALEAEVVLYNDNAVKLDYEYWTCLTLTPGSIPGNTKTTSGAEIIAPVSKIKIPSWYPDIASKEIKVTGQRGIYFFDKLRYWPNWSSDGIAYAWDDEMKNFWGVINQDNKEGIIRIADNSKTPGLKIWAWDFDQSQNIDPFYSPANVKRPYIELWAGHSKEFFAPANFEKNSIKRWKEIYAPTVGLSGVTHAGNQIIADCKIRSEINGKEANISFSTTRPSNQHSINIEITGNNPNVLLAQNVLPDPVNGNNITVPLPANQTWTDSDSLRYTIKDLDGGNNLTASVSLKNISTGIAGNTNNIPLDFDLHQNYPNPFNPETVIEYSLAKPVHVTLKVYDILGREIAVLIDSYKNAGIYKIILNANGYGMSSGIYFYTLKTPEFTRTRKLSFIK